MGQSAGLPPRPSICSRPSWRCGAGGPVQHHDLWSRLKRPIDGGATFRGRRVFGDNKTWRGVACAGRLRRRGRRAEIPHRRPVGSLAVIDYGEANPFTLGAAMGLGAMLGELPNSFVKRRLDIAPGGGASRHPGAGLLPVGPGGFPDDHLADPAVLGPARLGTRTDVLCHGPGRPPARHPGGVLGRCPETSGLTKADLRCESHRANIE